MNIHYIPAITIKIRSLINLFAIIALAITLACGSSSTIKRSQKEAALPTKAEYLPPEDQYIIITLLGNGMYEVNDTQVKESEFENFLMKEIENSSVKTVYVRFNSLVQKDLIFVRNTANRFGVKISAITPELEKKLGIEGSKKIK